jgi:Family of unknown function (DUF5691)
MDGRMSASALKGQVLPALLLGVSRQPIDFSRLFDGAISAGDPKSGLKALALAGQALRFERPAPPSHYAAIQTRSQSRPNPPEALRPKLVRLFGDGKYAVPPQDDLALAVALAFERQRLQLHPFDFPRMDGFLRAHAERLGPEARAWVDRDRPDEEKRGYFDSEALDDDNWREATPARRQRYIEDRRRQDAGVARALVEAVWPNEGAELRLRLLQALRPELSAADIPFLQGLAGDRAPRVRQLAERYLSRLPGAVGHNPALTLIIERIVRSEAGLLRKGPKLKLELPATVTGESWRDWIIRSFEDVEFDELAHALNLPSAEIIAAAAGDQYLSPAIAIMAFRQGDAATARQAYDAMVEVSPWLEWWLLQAIEMVAPKTRQDLVEFLISKALVAGSLTPVTLRRAHRSLNGQMSEALMDEILRAPIWSQWAAAPEDQHSLIFAPVAAVCPRAKRPTLREALAAIESGPLAIIHQFLDILDSLEKVSPHE